MSSGMLSLKWNNHRSTFFHVLSSIRSKESYCDATLACDGRFYPVHKLVLSTCSEYFEQIFEKTQCKHPVIVLKDIKFDDLEALMNYMYVGEVNVLQEKLSGLIKAAECLKIKGLAVPDEDPFASKENRRNQHRAEFESPRAKRRRKESFSNEDRGKNLSHRSQPRERQTNEILENVNLSTPKSTETNLSQILGGNTLSKADKSSEEIVHDNSEEDEQSSSKQFNSDGLIKKVSSHKRKGEISLIEANVKAEPPDIDIPDEDNLDSKENLHTDLGYDPNAGDLESLVDDESGSAHGGNDSEFSENILESAPQSVEDVVAQALPSSSNFQGNSFSLWEGDNSLQSFPGEGYSGDNSQGRQMIQIQDDIDVKQNHRRCVENDGKHPITVSPSSKRSRSSSPGSVYSNASQPSPSSYAGGRVLSSFEKFSAPPSLKPGLNAFASLLSDTMAEDPLRYQQQSTYKASFPIQDTNSKHGNVCELCFKSFPFPVALKLHMRTHTGEKPYSCPYCNYRTSQKGNLITHVRTHTGEEPFVCSFCPCRFKSGSALNSHLKTKHNS